MYIINRFKSSFTSGVDISPEGRMTIFDDRVEVIVDSIGPFESEESANEFAKTSEFFYKDYDYSVHELISPNTEPR